MKIDVAVIPGELQYLDLSGMTAVVIDVFRFTTTAAAYLQKGAERIVPTSSIQEALQLREASLFPEPLLLAGEENAQPIAGFDFGNSPIEFTGNQVHGATAIMTTTNGTGAVQACSPCAAVVLANIRNAQSAADYVTALGGDVIIVPAGLRGRFSAEDFWCAGAVIAYLHQGQLTDGAKMALQYFQTTPISSLRDSDHGKYLLQLGLDKDIRYCLDPNMDTLVPVMDVEHHWIKAARKTPS